MKRGRKKSHKITAHDRKIDMRNLAKGHKGRGRKV
jgi:hypothetical protein